jgi:hypothetical protein
MSGGGLRADLQRSEETWELRTDGIEVRWPVEGGPVMGVPRDGGGCWGGGGLPARRATGGSRQGMGALPPETGEAGSPTGGAWLQCHTV